MNIGEAKRLYLQYGLLDLTNKTDQKIYKTLFQAGYTMKTHADTLGYCIELEKIRR